MLKLNNKHLMSKQKAKGSKEDLFDEKVMSIFDHSETKLNIFIVLILLLVRTSVGLSPHSG